MRDVLVTGASGFIGQHLVQRLLARGDRVRALVRSKSRGEVLARLGAALCLGDVTRPESLGEAVFGCRLVFHLAGLISAPRLSAFLAVNEGGTRYVAAACAEAAQPPRLIVVSSLAAAGPAPRAEPRREADPPCPVSHYGRSKLAGERAAAEYAQQVRVSIVRPPIVFGPADPGTLLMFRPIARHGLQPLFAGRNPRYSLIHVEDLCTGLLQVAEHGNCLPGGVYYLADPQPCSLVELGEGIARAVGRAAPRRLSVPRWLAWAVGACGQAWGMLTGRMSHVNIDKVCEALAGDWICSPQRAQDELGFAPAASLEERLHATTQWYREHGWL